mgnify:CR=1 FL=1
MRVRPEQGCCVSDPPPSLVFTSHMHGLLCLGCMLASSLAAAAAAAARFVSCRVLPLL